MTELQKKEIAAQDDLLTVLPLLDKANLQYWLNGGWGSMLVNDEAHITAALIDIGGFCLSCGRNRRIRHPADPTKSLYL